MGGSVPPPPGVLEIRTLGPAGHISGPLAWDFSTHSGRGRLRLSPVSFVQLAVSFALSSHGRAGCERAIGAGPKLRESWR